MKVLRDFCKYSTGMSLRKKWQINTFSFLISSSKHKRETKKGTEKLTNNQKSSSTASCKNSGYCFTGEAEWEKKEAERLVRDTRRKTKADQVNLNFEPTTKDPAWIGNSAATCSEC